MAHPTSGAVPDGALPDGAVPDGALPDEAGRWQHRVELPTAAATAEFGRRLAGLLGAGDLVVLTGDLGAGKTTLTQGIGAGLGVRGRIASPTFIIARTHAPATNSPAPGGPALVHVDAYRLHSLAEVDDLDLDTTLEEAVTVVEWGAGLVEDLSADRLEITLHRQRGAGGDIGDQPRQVTISGYGDRWAEVDLADLPGVDLPGADLPEADLRGTDVRGTDAPGAERSAGERPDGERPDGERADGEEER